MRGFRKQGLWSICRMVVILGLSPLLCISLLAEPTQAASTISIPPGASDSEACALIEEGHRRGIDYWKSNNLQAALDQFKSCAQTLTTRNLWMPPKLSKSPTADQLRAYEITNKVIFSLAAIHQRMGYRTESERYAAMARERRLLPKLVIQGQSRCPSH